MTKTSCKIRGVETLIADKPFTRTRTSSVIILGNNEIETKKVKSDLEKQTGFKLKKVNL